MELPSMFIIIIIVVFLFIFWAFATFKELGSQDLLVSTLPISSRW